MALAHLVAQLADGEDLLHAGRRVGDEVERARQRPDLAEQRDLHEQPQVLAQRVLGVHRHREQLWLDLARLERERGGVEGGRQRTLGVHLAHQHTPAVACGEQRQRRRDRRLADTALAGDEDQPPVEDRAAPRSPSASEADAAVAIGGADLDVRDLGRRHADVATALVGDPQHVGRAAERRLDLRLRTSSRSSSGPPR